MRPTLAAVALLVLGTQATAGITSSGLAEIGVLPPADARVPLDSEWRDEHGARKSLGEVIGQRPALAIFADFTCSTLCGPVLGFAADALARSGLRPGADYRVVVLGLDPKDGPEQAAHMKRERIGDARVASATSFLGADAPTVRRVADALGYRFAYDAGHDQFAHPAAVFALTARGRVTRVLSGLGIDPADLRLALIEAGEGRVGTLVDHVRLLCYGFDPAIGAYTLAVRRGLFVVSALSVLALAALIGWMSLPTGPRAA
jgi:protein SCO1/2